MVKIMLNFIFGLFLGIIIGGLAVYKGNGGKDD
jgi:hypothetical protein